MSRLDKVITIVLAVLAAVIVAFIVNDYPQVSDELYVRCSKFGL